MDPQHLLVRIVKILNQLKIPYFVTGGMAIYVWGRPRFTADIDIIIELKDEKVKKLVEILTKVGYIDEDSVRQALQYSSEFNFVDHEVGVKVDFWVIKDDEFDKSRLKRAIAKKVLNKRVYFISPEDLILKKLLWHQESQSMRQLEDIQSIMQMQKNKLDFAYLTKWAKRQKTLGILEEMISLVSKN